jgi:16S rRNA C967 or C1407 C5-methylase (RsmB/RsmF family)
MPPDWLPPTAFVAGPIARFWNGFCRAHSHRDIQEIRMATVTFDTLKFTKTLEAAGFSTQQAEAVAEALKEAQSDQKLVTQEYLDYRLKAELADLKTDLIKWMTGALMAQAVVIAMLVKLL